MQSVPVLEIPQTRMRIGLVRVSFLGVDEADHLESTCWTACGSARKVFPQSQVNFALSVCRQRYSKHLVLAEMYRSGGRSFRSWELL